MRVYLAGAMRGHDLYNFPAFDRYATHLRLLGHEVISPAELDRATGFDETVAELPDGFVQEAMRRDVGALLDVDGIVLMPGWRASSGACFEWDVARRLGLLDFEVHVVDEGRPSEWCYLTRVGEQWTKRSRKGFRPYGPIGDPDTDERGEEVGAVWATADGRIGIRSGATTEVRVTSETGGQKGSKAQAIHHIPPRFLLALGAVYAAGNAKYPDAEPGRPNWSRGYDWSLSYSAMHRHAAAMWAGEWLDPEDGQPHVVKIAWHAATLMTFHDEGLGVDDRPAYYRTAVGQ